MKFEMLIACNENARFMNHYPNTSSFGVYNDQSLRSLQGLPVQKHYDG